MKKADIKKKVAHACKLYCIARKIPSEQVADLSRLALKSFTNMPAKDQHKWTLEQVMIQKLI